MTEGMLEELAVGVITPNRCLKLKRYRWRSTITSPVGLGSLGLDLLSMLGSLTKELFGVRTHIVYVVVDHEYNVVVQVRHEVHEFVVLTKRTLTP